MEEKGSTVNVILRLPPEVHAAMKAWAKDERRPMNWQIVRVLELALAERQAKLPQPPEQVS